MKLLLSICSLIILGFNTLSAQDNPETISAKLNPLLVQLNDYVTTAPLEDKYERVKQVQFWLDALDAYASLGTLNLNDDVAKLDETELVLLNELTTGIATITSGKQDDPAAATQAIKAKMPAVKNQFQVDNSLPYTYYAGQNSSVTLSFKGQFPLLLKDTNEVYLTNGTFKIGYSHATDTTITFQFSSEQLGLTNASPMSVNRLEMHLVGQVGKKVNKKKQFISVYHLQAIALPTSPGKLTITRNSKSSNTEKQTKRTRTFLLNGSKGNLVEKQCIPNHDGWSLIPESVDLVVESSGGQKNRDWAYRKTNTGGKTCFTTEVFFNSSGPSGKLEYHLKYDIQRSTKAEQTETSEVALSWGENKQLDFELPIISVVYTNFLGETVRVDGTSFQSPWLQLELRGQNIAVKTPNITSQTIIP